MTATLPRSVCRSGCRLFLLTALLGLLSVQAAEPLLTLKFDSLEHETLQLTGVTVELTDEPGAAAGYRLTTARLQLSPEQSFSDLSLQCEGRISAAQITCHQGNLSLQHPQLGLLQSSISFEYTFGQGLQQANLKQLKIAGASIAASFQEPAEAWRISADFDGVDVKELSTLLGLAGLEPSPEAFAGGTVSGSVIAHGWPLRFVTADLTFTDINYSATSVAQSMNGKLDLTLQRDGEVWQGDMNVSADGGELYIVPPVTAEPPGFYVAIGDRPLTLSSVFSYDTEAGHLTLQDMDYTHPGVMRVNLAGQAQITPAFEIAALSLRIPDSDMEQVYPVYLQPWLLDTIYNDLRMQGQAAMEIGLRGDELTALALDLNGVDIIDANDRFALRDLTTSIQMTEARRHTSRVSWNGIDIYRIGLGQGAITLASNGFNIEVTHWQDVPLLDGSLNIAELDLHNVGTPDFELHMAGAVKSVSLPALTQALDWPTLGGTLSGEFTGLTYRDGDIRMDGELLVRMFDGRVRLRNLDVNELFGNVPVLTADITVDNISLEQLTDTFAFGKITGGLSGYIRNLRLENWQPVAFDAKLSTRDDGDTRHRISQKALNNLSQIGGGLSGALSRGFLRYFDEYSYGELGLSCRLENGFCELGGVEAYEGGHYLLTRGGLLPPWVEVKLAGSIISWDALIEGFEQMAQGEVKID